MPKILGSWKTNESFLIESFRKIFKILGIILLKICFSTHRKYLKSHCKDLKNDCKD